MDTLKHSLIEKARRTYRAVHPCGLKERLEDCFTIVGNKCVFWFNTEDNSTHVVVAELPSS